MAGSPAVVLETAHPAKFPEEIERILGFSPQVPLALSALDQLSEDFDSMDVDYPAFAGYLKANYGR
jgi:threonine synthase